MQKYLLLANECIIFNNDIVSFEKELLESNKELERMYNVVARTAILDKCSIQDALKMFSSGREEQGKAERRCKALIVLLYRTRWVTISMPAIPVSLEQMFEKLRELY